MTDGPQKIASYVPVSAEVLADGGFLVPELFRPRLLTPSQRAANTAERRKRADAARAAADARHVSARATLHPLLVPVLDHHGPHVGDYYADVMCWGCDEGPYAEASPEWPCSTWCLITGQTAEAQGG